MNNLADKLRRTDSQPIASQAARKTSNGTLQFKSNRPSTIAQRKLQEVIGSSSKAKQLKAFQSKTRSSAQLKRTTQLQQGKGFRGRLIQRVNRLTMHSAPYDVRLAGGGKGSRVNTEAEVLAIIASNNLQDLKDSRRALSISIGVRKDALNPDSGHDGRMTQEKGWLLLFDAAIRPLEAQAQARRNQALRGTSTMVQGPGFTLPTGPAWGGARLSM